LASFATAARTSLSEPSELIWIRFALTRATLSVLKPDCSLTVRHMSVK
jgi:hypothetical protein